MSLSDAVVTDAERTPRTARFRMGGAAFAAEMFRRRGRVPLLLAAGAVAILALGALIWSCVELLVVALMVLFLIMPMAAAFLYYSYGLRPDCALNVADHDVTFLSGALRVRIYVCADEESDGEESGEVERVYERVLTLPHPVEWRLRRGAVSLSLADGGFLWLPYSSFDSADDFRRALDLIRNERT